MIVTVSGRSGLRNAYRSVLSAIGSWLMRGASRWLDATTRNVADTVNAETVKGSSHLFTGFSFAHDRRSSFPLLRTESTVGFTGFRLCGLMGGADQISIARRRRQTALRFVSHRHCDRGGDIGRRGEECGNGSAVVRIGRAGANRSIGR